LSSFFYIFAFSLDSKADNYENEVNDNAIVGRYTVTTIKEVAERANVSIGTVDRVIHKRGRVSKKTEEIVRRILEELDYKPNIFAKHLRLSRTFAFGIVLPRAHQDSAYWSLPVRGITKAQNELSLQKVKVRYFFYDKYSKTPLTGVRRDLFASKLDGLLIAPVLSKVFDSFVKEIPVGLPYVFFDSFIPNASYVSFIGQDSFKSGILSARLMQVLIGGQGSVAVIRVLPDDYHINDRVNGFLSFCKKHPAIESRVYEVDATKSKGNRQKVFKQIMYENTTLNGIFVTNASTHEIADYIGSQSFQRKIHIIGYDLIEENIRYLKKGVIDFLISQQSERQGYEGIYALYKNVVLKERLEKNIMMPLDIICNENVNYYKS
jgi:LacI family transcriptional regulator